MFNSAVRAKLGLKPLDVGKKEVDEEKESLKDDVHKPAVNLAEVKRTADIREKMLAAKEKRKLNQRLGSVITDQYNVCCMKWCHRMS